MFTEALVAWLVEKYFGSFVENVNSRDLTLFGLPFAVRRGTMGTLRLRIPWRSLASQSVQVEASDLFAVLGPSREAETSDDDPERSHQAKMERVARSERLLTRQCVTTAPVAEGPAPVAGFGERLLSTVLANMTLRVKRVHVRYEDVDSGGESWAAGVTIGEVALVPTDSSWKPAFLTEASAPGSLSFRLGSLSSLAVYWDSREAPRAAECSGVQDFSSVMRKIMEDGSARSYVLRPMSAELRMTQSPAESPALRAVMSLGEEIVAVLGRQQYHQLLELVGVTYNYLGSLQRVSGVPRPSCGVSGHAREWWSFATSSVLAGVRDRRRRLSSEYIAKRRRYMAVYTERLNGRGNAQEADELERELTDVDIVLLRSMAILRLKLDKKRLEELAAKRLAEAAAKDKAQKESWSGWAYRMASFGRAGSGSAPSQEGESGAGASALSAVVSFMSEEDRAELEKIVDDRESAALPKGSHDELGGEVRDRASVEVSLARARLVLAAGDRTSISEATCEGLSAKYVSTSQEGRWSLVGSFCSASVLDTTSSKTLLSLGKLPGGTAMSLHLESTPQDVKADMRVKAELAPASLVLDTASLRRMLTFFHVPTTVDLDALRGDVAEYLSDLSSAQVQKILESHMRVDLDLQVNSPTISAPLGDSTIVFRPGNLVMRTWSGSTREYAEGPYDHFSVEASSVAVDIGGRSAVDPFNITLRLSKCQLPLNDKWPRIALSTSVSQIRLFVDETTISSICALVDSPLLSPSQLFMLEDQAVDDEAEPAASRVSGTGTGSLALANLVRQDSAGVLFLHATVNLASVDALATLNGVELFAAKLNDCRMSLDSDPSCSKLEMVFSSITAAAHGDAQPFVCSSHDGQLLRVHAVVPTGSLLPQVAVSGGELTCRAHIPFLCKLLELLRIGVPDPERPEQRRRRSILPTLPIVSVTLQLAALNVDFLSPDTARSQFVGVVTKAEATVQANRKTFSAKGTMRTLSLSDTTEGTLDAYRGAMQSLGDEDLLSFTLATHDIADPDFPGFSTVLSVDVGSFRVAYVQKFFMDTFLKWLGTLAARRPHPPPKPEHVSAGATRFMYRFASRHPQLVLPRSATSEQHFAADLGELVVLENSFLEEGRRERIRLSIPSLRFTDNNGASAGSVSDLVLDFCVPGHTAVRGEVPNIEIVADMRSLELLLNARQYCAFLAMFWENFGYEPDVPQLDAAARVAAAAAAAAARGEFTNLYRINVREDVFLRLRDPTEQPLISARLSGIVWKIQQVPRRTSIDLVLREAHATALYDLQDTSELLTSGPSAEQQLLHYSVDWDSRGSDGILLQNMLVEFNFLKVRANRETWIKVFQFCYPDAQTMRSISNPDAVVLPTKYTLSSRLHKLVVVLTRPRPEPRELAEMVIDDITLSNSSLSGAHTASATLHNLTVWDMASRVSPILDFPSAEVISVSLDYAPGDRFVISLKGKSLRCLYSPTFFSALSSWADELSALATHVGQGTTQAVRNNSIVPWLALDVELVSPQFSIRHRDAILVLYLGHLSLVSAPTIRSHSGGLLIRGRLTETRAILGEHAVVSDTACSFDFSPFPLALSFGIESTSLAASHDELLLLRELFSHINFAATAEKRVETPAARQPVVVGQEVKDTSSLVDFSLCFSIKRLKVTALGVAEGTCENLKVDAGRSGAGGRWDGRLELGALALVDQRPERSEHFRDLVASKSKDSLFALDCSYEPVSHNVVVEAVLRNTLISVLPQAILSLISFADFSRGGTIAAALASPSPPSSPAVPVSPRAQSFTLGSVLSSWTVHSMFNLSAEVVLPEDVNSSSSRLMILEMSLLSSLDSDQKEGRCHSSLTLEELRLFTCVADSREATRQSVLESAQTVLDAQLTEKLLNVHLSVPKAVMIAASFNDIKLIAVTTAALRQPRTSPVILPIAPPPVRRNRGYAVSPIPTAPEDVAKRAARGPEVRPRRLLLGLEEVVASADVRQASCTLLNDLNSENTPVVSTTTTLFAKHISSQRTTELKAEVSCNVWNVAVSGWQPLLEPWQFCVSLTPAQISLSSDRRLDLTVTPAAVTSLTSLVSTFTAERTAFGKSGFAVSRRSTFYPFELRNCCGEPLSWSLPGFGKGALADGQTKKLGAAYGRDSRWAQAVPAVVGTFRAAGIETAWPIERETTLVEDGLAMTVRSTAAGSKIVTFGSRVTLRNDCRELIDVRLVLEDRRLSSGDSRSSPPVLLERVFGRVAPGSAIFVPIAMATNGCKLRVRLSSPPSSPRSAAASAAWSDSMILSNLESRTSARAYISLSSRGPDGTSWFSVRACSRRCQGPRSGLKEERGRYDDDEEGYEESSYASRMPFLVDISVRPQFNLVNELSCDVQFQLSSGETGLLSKASAKGMLSISAVSSDVLLSVLPCNAVATPLRASPFAPVNVTRLSSRKLEPTRSLVCHSGATLQPALRIDLTTITRPSQVTITLSARLSAINKTGIPVAVSTGSEEYTPLTLLADELAQQPLCTDEKLALCCSGTRWSRLISVDKLRETATGYVLFCESLSRSAQDSCEFVVVARGAGLVVIEARYLLRNLSSIPLEFTTNPSLQPKIILPGQSLPVSSQSGPVCNDRLFVRQSGSNQWAELPLSTADEFPLSLDPVAPNTVMLHVSASLGTSPIAMRITLRDSSFPLFVIENRLPVGVAVGQADCTCAILPGHHLMPFAWSDPAKPRLLMALDTSIDISKLGRLPAFLPCWDFGEVVVEIVADGPTRVARLWLASDPEIQRSSVAGPKSTITQCFSVELSEIGVSVVSAEPEELLYLTVEDALVRYVLAGKDGQRNLVVMAGSFQLDNQSRGCSHEVVLYPKRGKNGKSSQGPVLTLGVNFAAGATANGFLYFQKVFLRLLPLTLKLEEAVVSRLGRLYAYVLEEMEAVKRLASHSADPNGVVAAASPQQVQTRVHVESLIVPSFDVAISYTLTEGFRHSQGKLRLFRPIWGAIARLEDGHVSFPDLVAEGVGGTVSSVLDRVFNHYKTALLKNAFKLALSTEVLGNFPGLFRDVKTGLTDLRDKDLDVGLASVVVHTTAGVSGSLGAFTSYLGSQLRSISGDDSYVHTKPPKDFGEGAASSLRSLAGGVIRGLTGVVTVPADRVKREGMRGLIPGMLHGAVGVVAQPVAGVAEAVSSASRGVRSEIVGVDQVKRKRLPRHITPEGSVEPYREDLAYCQLVISSLDPELVMRAGMLVTPENRKHPRALILTTTGQLLYGFLGDPQQAAGLSNARVLYRVDPVVLEELTADVLLSQISREESWHPKLEDQVRQFLSRCLS